MSEGEHTPLIRLPNILLCLCVCVRVRARACVCVCVRVYSNSHICCVCVCVRARAEEKEGSAGDTTAHAPELGWYFPEEQEEHALVPARSK